MNTPQPLPFTTQVAVHMRNPPIDTSKPSDFSRKAREQRLDRAVRAAFRQIYARQPDIRIEMCDALLNSFVTRTETETVRAHFSRQDTA